VDDMNAPTPQLVAVDRRVARGGTLILGGGFGGAHVARCLGRSGATIVTPDSSMLYTPLLPEVAAGAIEPRHATIPLRTMCPHAELMLGRAIALDEAAGVVTVETETGTLEVQFDDLVVALGADVAWAPVPGLIEHAMGFKSLGDAVHLRDHVLGELDTASADPGDAERHLCFVVIGAGYAGVEALAELQELVDRAVQHRPELHAVPRRWVLVDRAPNVLPEVPEPLARYAAELLLDRGVEIRLSTTLTAVDDITVTLSDGTQIETETVVWTAGVRPSSALASFNLPLDRHGRVIVDPFLRVRGRSRIWALGDGAAVPNGATPGRTDPPTCQHALRQARRLVKNLRGLARPYRYRSLGQGATLGQDKGVVNLLGVLNVRGALGAVLVRWYHLRQIPELSRRIRVLTDGTLSFIFGRDAARGVAP
jgi:NADH dehydrogenase